MTKKEFFLKTLYKNNNITTEELTNLYYEECQSDVESKRKYYFSEGIEKTEKELKTQIKGEFSCITSQKWNKDFQYISVDKSNSIFYYSLTQNGKKYYEENFLEEIDNNIQEIIEENAQETNGIVYLLKSQTFENTYKIGITTRTIDKRIDELNRHNSYGLFNLKPIMYFTCCDYAIMERVLHKLFENFRLCKKNELFVDTEIFKGLDTIEIEFELFANYLKSNPRYKNVELIKKLT